jgi:hypothetical protein
LPNLFQWIPLGPKGGFDIRLHFADIPQVACRLMPSSPEFARWTSIFCPDQRLRSRKLLEQGWSDPEPSTADGESFPALIRVTGW